MTEYLQQQQYNNFEELTFPAEEWRVIAGTNEKYFISSLGRVVHKQKNNKLFVIEPWNDKGYKRISIQIYGKKKNLYVHRLVA